MEVLMLYVILSFGSLSLVLFKESGPDHNKEFEVEVSWNGKILASGSGNNKKEAEAMAAQNAINAESWN